MKKSALNRIIIWSVVSGILIIMLILGFVINENGRYIGNVNEYISSNSAYNLTTSDGLSLSPSDTNFEYDITDINVNLCNGKVIFKKSGTDTLNIKAYYNATTDEASKSDFYYGFNDSGEFMILGEMYDKNISDEPHEDLNFSEVMDILQANATYDEQKTLVIEIPSEFNYLTVSVNVANADIEIDGLETDNNLYLNSFSGNISIKDTKAPYINANSTSGEITFTNSEAQDVAIQTVSSKCNINGTYDGFRFNSVSGSLDYSTENLKQSVSDISIDTVSGSATLYLPNDFEFNLDNSSLSGSVTNELGGSHKYGNNEDTESGASIEFNSVSGSLYLKPIEQYKAAQHMKQATPDTASKKKF